MPPKFVTLVRHGEALHNKTGNSQLLDPCLTLRGIEQCRNLNDSFLKPAATSSPTDGPDSLETATLETATLETATLDNVIPSTNSLPPPPPDILVSSPLTRTLQTTVIGFSGWLTASAQQKVLPLALLQETADLPCDSGRPVHLLKTDFSGKGTLTEPELGDLAAQAGGVVDRIDWDLIDHEFPNKTGLYSADKEVLTERARRARRWIYEREEGHVCAILHGGFLHFMTEDWSDRHGSRGTGWYNTEYRTYEFLPLDDHKDEAGHHKYSIREIEWSRERRKEKPLTGTEKKEAKEIGVDGGKAKDGAEEKQEV